MKKRRILTKLALVLLIVFIVAWMKPLLKRTWVYISGAVIAHKSSTHSYTYHHNVLLSVGGDRWVGSDKQEEATAYHALVVPPPVNLREDGSISGGDGFTENFTFKWLCQMDPGGTYQSPKSLTISYHAITQRVAIGSDTYWLAKGNIFVVRLDDEWRPHVTQVGAIFDKATNSDEIVEFFKRALPDDEAVKTL